MFPNIHGAIRQEEKREGSVRVCAARYFEKLSRVDPSQQMYIRMKSRKEQMLIERDQRSAAHARSVFYLKDKGLTVIIIISRNGTEKIAGRNAA